MGMLFFCAHLLNGKQGKEGLKTERKRRKREDASTLRGWAVFCTFVEDVIPRASAERGGRGEKSGGMGCAEGCAGVSPGTRLAHGVPAWPSARTNEDHGIARNGAWLELAESRLAGLGGGLGRVGRPPPRKAGRGVVRPAALFTMTPGRCLIGRATRTPNESPTSEIAEPKGHGERRRYGQQLSLLVPQALQTRPSNACSVGTRGPGFWKRLPTLRPKK